MEITKVRGQERNLKGAVRAFDRLKQKVAQINTIISNCLLEVCVQCGDTAAALVYFQHIKQLGFADVVCYNTVLKANLAFGSFLVAQASLLEMAQRGHPANGVTYNEFLSACKAARDCRI